jgi:predicted NBD/HSP70 family sugar kinase
MRISDPELNRLQVIKAVRRAEPVARTDLVKLTGLAAGTVSQLTAHFVERGVLVEEKAQGRAFGRPRIELRINAQAGYALSVFHRSYGRADIEIVDLRGDPVFAHSAPLGRVDTLEKRAGQLAVIIDEAIATSPLSKDQIHRVGVVVHGVVNTTEGIVHWLVNYDGADVPFASLIEQQIQIPVVIDNDTDVIARAEHWFGGEGLDDFGVVVIDAALSSAYYVDGALWAGVNGISPELGHTKVAGGDMRRCYCGATGCLATHCAAYAIVERICEQRGLAEPDPEQPEELFRRFAQEALAGEPIARETFEAAGRMLGTAVANILNDRDPGPLFIIAFEPDVLALISAPLQAALEANTLQPVLQRAKIHLRTVDSDHYRKGTAALALEAIYRR